jgi:uncharacterized membrane protein
MEVAAALGLLTTVLVASVSFPGLPPQIPTHFNLAGEPDGWGPRATIFLLPGLGVVLHVLLTFAAKIPHRCNYLWPITEQNAPRQYLLARRVMNLLKAQIVWMFAIFTWRMTAIGRGEAAQLGLWHVGLLLALIVGTLLWYIASASRAR